MIPLAAALNCVALAVVASLYQGIKELNGAWLHASQERLHEATLLTELERSLGNDGLIHRFKSHVLRQESGDSDQALAAHERASTLVSHLAETELGRDHPAQTRALERTFVHWGEALQRAVDTEHASLSPAELDSLARVPDAGAAKALVELRAAAGKISTTVIAETAEQVERLGRRLWISTGILSLLVVALLVSLQRSLLQAWSLSDRYRRLHLGSPDGILLCDERGRILEASPAACRLFGYTSAEMHALTLDALVPAHLREGHARERIGFTGSTEERPLGMGPGSLKGVRKDGSEVPVQISLAGQDSTGERNVLAIVRDLSHTERLRSESTTDHLTRALNRRGFESFLDKELERNARYHHGLAVLLIDLDHFKRVNDTAGHAAGDEVLQDTVEFISTECRAGDHVGRWGGDEIIVLCPELKLEAALQLGMRLIAEFGRRSQEEFRGTSLSIGVACVPPGVHDPTSADELIAAADQALYTAKEQGRACVRYTLVPSPAPPRAVRRA